MLAALRRAAGEVADAHQAARSSLP
jgi:hypothetical protein